MGGHSQQGRSWESDLLASPTSSPTPLPGAATCPPLPGPGFSTHQPDSLPSTQGKRLPRPGCFQEAPGQAPALFRPCSQERSQPDTMKSSGPVERLLRALGRRDSSRATSRVGAPTSWAKVGRVEVRTRGEGQDSGQTLLLISTSSPAPHPASVFPLILLAP